MQDQFNRGQDRSEDHPINEDRKEANPEARITDGNRWRYGNGRRGTGGRCNRCAAARAETGGGVDGLTALIAENCGFAHVRETIAETEGLGKGRGWSPRRGVGDPKDTAEDRALSKPDPAGRNARLHTSACERVLEMLVEIDAFDELL